MTGLASYVAPEERSTGFKIKRVFDEKADCMVSKSVQTTFQFVPISKTLAMLFNDPEFENLYMNFNEQNNHKCTEGIYKNFCCGEVYKSNEFFKTNPFAIQIRLFTDDFELCDPLKSKAGVHKTTAYYFQINNLPPNVLSKTENIPLVALSDAADSKNELADVDNVIKTIIADIKTIETNGIITASKRVLKGTLIFVSFDNLGGNVLYGFSGGFNANYYCRICTSKRTDCQKMVKENPKTLRTIDEYDQIIAKIETDAHLSLSETKGIKTACPLNSMDHFHILTNMTVEFMHDVFEGSAGFLTEEVIHYCVSQKIASLAHLQTLVEYYPYGKSWNQSKPSKLNPDKKNVGQNASQARCLIFHLPFILYKFKTQLEPIWEAVETMLQIIQILSSDEIMEADLERLSSLITKHLECYQQLFNQPLKPKHHFLLHYLRIIRAMGPVIMFWAFRMEAKHQFFKRNVYKTNNFVNIKKSLALKHQELVSMSNFVLNDEVTFGKQFSFIECDAFESCFDKLKTKGFADYAIRNARVSKSLRVNDRQYRPGSLLLSDKIFHEIKYIICIENISLFFCERSYKILGYDSYFNSLKIESIENDVILNFEELENNKSYEKINVDGSFYVIADNLATFRIIPQ